MVGVVTIETIPLKEKTADTDHPQLDFEARSIRNTDQAWDLCKGTESANKARSERATIMELEYSGQAPFSQSDKVQTGQSWQSNVNTGILAGITDRKVLRFVNAIVNQIYLTRSSLPTTWPDWKRKSDLFDIHATRMIQGWNKYATFVNTLAKENVLHGYAYAVFLDPYTWTPKFFKQDISYVPDESTQNPEDLQFFVIKQDYLLHEFVELFEDEEAADDQGFNIPNCVRAANESEVKNPREDALVTEFRKFAEFIQDGVLGLTYSVSGPRVVKTYLLWNREYDGKVSAWIIHRDDGKLLRFASKIYDSMADVVQLFSFQPGNGHLHSSKGIGRMIIGNVKIAEKLRNAMVDNVKMASLVMLKASSKDRNKLQPVVQAPFIVMDGSIEISQTKFEADTEGYAAMDQRLVNFMEQAAGAYITPDPNNSQQPQTATGESIDAKREQENQDMTESRWKDQFSGLVQTMQKRAFSDDNIDEAIKFYDKIVAGEQETEDFYDGVKGDIACIKTIVDMLKDGLAEDEIKVLRTAPTSGYAHTDDAVTANGVLAVQKGFTGNPNIDQVKLTMRAVEALAGPDMAKELCIDSPDQTVLAEAVRAQQGESSSMATLQIPAPVSPRDNHLIHGMVCMQLLNVQMKALSSTMQPPPQLLKVTELTLNHLGAHLAAYMATGGVSQNPQFKQLNDFYKNFKLDLEKVLSTQAHAQMGAKVGAITHNPELGAKIAAQGGQAITQPIPGASQGGGAPPGTTAGGTSPEGPDIPQSQEALRALPSPMDNASKDMSRQPMSSPMA
jgi:hypothetical protein